MPTCIRCGNDAVVDTKFCRAHDPGTHSQGIGARIEEKLNQYKDGIIREDQLMYELGLVIGEMPGPIHKIPTEKTQLKYAAKAIRKELAKVNRILKARENVKALRAKLEDLRYLNAIK